MLSLALLSEILEQFLNLLQLNDHNLDLVLIQISHASLSSLLLEQLQLVVVLVVVPISESLKQFRIVVLVHLSIHLEQLLSQSGGEGIHFVGLWFGLLLEFLLELVNLYETLLSHVHLVLHDQLLSALLSHVSRIKLL